MTIGIDIKNFEFIDMPPKSSMSAALKQLKHLGAIKSTDHLQLTDIGKQMSHFPLDPTLSKVIITSQHFKCLDEILDLVSILSAENIFCEENNNNRDQAAVQHSKFKSNLGDHFTLLNVFSQYKLHNRENKVRNCFGLKKK
jgi:HrpA-like RNA helicase